MPSCFATRDPRPAARDPRLATSADRLVNAAACIAELDRIFAALDLADWKDALPAMTVPWTVVQTAAEAVVDPQVGANDLVTDIEGRARRYPLVASSAQSDGLPPGLRPAAAAGGLEDDDVVPLDQGDVAVFLVDAAGQASQSATTPTMLPSCWRPSDDGGYR